MNKGSTKSKTLKDRGMRTEYDFHSGVRGKHHEAYRQGHSVIIHKGDATTIVQNYRPEDGTVILDPDVRDYFPTAEAVNHALRSLIALIPEKPRKSKSKPRPEQDSQTPLPTV